MLHDPLAQAPLGVGDIERLAIWTARHVVDFHNREDTRQEFCLGALEAERRAEPGRPVRAYQISYGRGYARTFWGRAKRRERREKAILQLPAGNGAEGEPGNLQDIVENPAAPDPRAGAERADVAAWVRRAVAYLPVERRRVIELHWFQGKTLKQAGAALGITRSAAGVREAAAFETLRKWLGNGQAKGGHMARKRKTAGKRGMGALGITTQEPPIVHQEAPLELREADGQEESELARFAEDHQEKARAEAAAAAKAERELIAERKRRKYFWPEGKGLPKVFQKRRVHPCPNCRRVLGRVHK